MKTLSILLLMLAGTGAANAQSLIGDTTTLNYLFPDTSNVYATSTFLVTGGVEANCPGSSGICSAFAETFSIAIDASSIIIKEAAGSNYNTGSFNGIDFTNLTFGSGITAFTLTTDLPGLTVADISFTSNSIEYNAAGLSFVNAPYTITLNLSGGAAPEPGTVGLFGLAGVALGLWRFRSGRKTA